MLNLISGAIFQLEACSYRADPRAWGRKAQLWEFPHRSATLLHPGALQAKCTINAERHQSKWNLEKYGSLIIKENRNTFGSDIMEVTPPSTGTAKDRFWQLWNYHRVRACLDFTLSNYLQCSCSRHCMLVVFVIHPQVSVTLQAKRWAKIFQ